MSLEANSVVRPKTVALCSSVIFASHAPCVSINRSATSSPSAVFLMKGCDQIQIPSVHLSIPGRHRKPSSGLMIKSASCRPSTMLGPHLITQSGTSLSIAHFGTSQASWPPGPFAVSERYRNMRSNKKDFPVRYAPITPTTHTFWTPVPICAARSCMSSSFNSSSPTTTRFVSKSIFTTCKGFPRLRGSGAAASASGGASGLTTAGATAPAAGAAARNLTTAFAPLLCFLDRPVCCPRTCCTPRRTEPVTAASHLPFCAAAALASVDDNGASGTLLLDADVHGTKRVP
mmetsp:Transcript_8197/g.19258  ORF Transcript_8197/g.19258 Transcript_8197/m.19258 type:complete len:288 (-) Transcript_8197:132-995(-)